MIMKARHHWIVYPFFKWYAVWKVTRNFQPVNIIGHVFDKGLPVLVVANHVSWWDGFWLQYLNQKLFHRKLHFMMLEEQLRKFWFFNLSGGYSVRKSSRSLIESLEYTVKLLGNNQNFVFIFPQGEIISMYKSQFEFEKGISYILKNLENPVQIIFVANLAEYFSKEIPTLNIYLEEVSFDQPEKMQIEARYNQFYQECIEKQTQIRS